MEQKRFSERKGERAKCREKKKTMVGRARWYGWTCVGSTKDRIWLSEHMGHSSGRVTIKGALGGHPQGERPDPEHQVAQRFSGQAFSWWGDKTPAEKDAAIAALVEKNAPMQAKIKAATQRKKKSPS